MLRSNQHRHDQFGTRCFHRTEQRRRIDRMDDRGMDWFKAACHLDQAFVAPAFLPQFDFGKDNARPGNLFDRRNDVRGAGDDFLAVLVHSPAIEDDPVCFLDFAVDPHRHGDRVAEADRPAKVQGLVHIDRPRTGKLCSQQGGNQRSAPHAMGHDLVEHIGFRIGLVEICRIDVPGHDRENLDVLVGEGPDQTGGIAWSQARRTFCSQYNPSQTPDPMLSRRCDSRRRYIRRSQ